MKKLWQSFTLATAMYSKLPTPRTNWDSDSMSLVFCFFPWIGLVIGAAELLWVWLASVLRLSGLLFGVIAALIPVAITGGIHDHFCLQLLQTHGGTDLHSGNAVFFHQNVRNRGLQIDINTIVHTQLQQAVLGLLQIKADLRTVAGDDFRHIFVALAEQFHDFIVHGTALGAA